MEVGFNFSSQMQKHMNDSNKEELAINTTSAKSIEAVQATKSDHPDEPLHTTTSVIQRKRRHFVRMIALMSLGAIAVIVFVPRSVLVQRYEGLGVALCFVACGVFLVRRFIRVLAEEDKLQEQQLKADQATASPSQPNPAGQETNLTTSPPEAGQDIK
jgi:hypothetical protein